MTRFVTRRFYTDSRIDMSNAKRFATALQLQQTVLIGINIYEPKSYKIFPDGVEFSCLAHGDFNLQRTLDPNRHYKHKPYR